MKKYFEIHRHIWEVNINMGLGEECMKVLIGFSSCSNLLWIRWWNFRVS